MACCFHGVAPTSWPDFRSCILSPPSAPAHATRDVTKITIPAALSASAEPALKSTNEPNAKRSVNDRMITLIISVPEIGLLVEPTNPHIYDEIAAAKKHNK